jgi:hypothetical protein
MELANPSLTIENSIVVLSHRKLICDPYLELFLLHSKVLIPF